MLTDSHGFVLVSLRQKFQPFLVFSPSSMHMEAEKSLPGKLSVLNVELMVALFRGSA